jgi:AcrR family transcriptional regulator
LLLIESPMATATRHEQKRQTRALILETAARFAGRAGLVATTTAEIAKAAGISHGSVFAHFATRDDLIAAVVADGAGRIARDVRARAGQGGSLREVLAAHLTSLEHHEAFYARLVIDAPFLPSAARRALVEIQSAISHHLDGALAREIAAGTVRDVPLDLAFNTWIGLVHHYVSNRELFAPRGSVIQRCGARLLDHYLMLLASESPRSSS